MAKKEKHVIKKYSDLVGDISGLLETARKESARTVNALLTATYWLIGYRIVEFEYQGREREEHYGDKLIQKLADDLTNSYGKGFKKSNIYLMKSFYLTYMNIFQTLSGKSFQKKSLILEIAGRLRLPWSAYVRLLSVKDNKARKFYEEEALRNGWSVRQLDRQISSQIYERTLLSKKKAAMLRKGEKPYCLV